ncbi:MAG TPA: hypothetical protein VF723_07365 [Pyrinomonadaceae bacterium]|jgi:hypothetical protein
MKVFIVSALLFLLLSIYPHRVVCQVQGHTSLNLYALRVRSQDGIDDVVQMHGTGSQVGLGFTLSPKLFVKQAAPRNGRASFIEFSARLRGEVWEVRVALTFGKYYDQGNKHIAAFRAREGEEVRLKELAQFGIKPLDVSIVRIERVASVQPTVVNQTTSLAVLSVEANVLPSPYQIVLKNMSDKAVRALEIVTSHGKGARTLKWPEGTTKHPLIGAWQEYRLEMPSQETRPGLSAFEYVPEQLHVIEINTVVFTDGTYEGNPHLAELQRAKDLGIKLQIERILPLIQSALGTADVDATFEQFKKAVLSLDEEVVPPASFEELKSTFPTLDATRKEEMDGAVRRSLHKVKFNLTGSIAEFERDSKQSGNGSFKVWLEKKREWYENRRSKLP